MILSPEEGVADKDITCKFLYTELMTPGNLNTPRDISEGGSFKFSDDLRVPTRWYGSGHCFCGRLSRHYPWSGTALGSLDLSQNVVLACLRPGRRA